jgi:pimeloyl-ACP methyl ester carboxylesterase
VRRPPVIIVPGILGSILAHKKTGEVEWITAAPGLELGPRPDLDFEISREAVLDVDAVKDDLMPVHILSEIPVVPFLYTSNIYKRLLDAFVDAGYTLGSCDFPAAGEDCFVFGYDFRKDAVATARELALAIERVRDARGNPAENVVLVAHSFGGLIARYYLMYGSRDVLTDEVGAPDGAGARNVNAVAFLGTPHGGAVSLLAFLLRGYGYIYDGQLIRSEEILTMPSSYQLLPRPRQDCFLDGTDPAKNLTPFRVEGGLPVNLYDSQAWMRMGWLPEGWRDGPRREFFENGLHRGLLWWTALDKPWMPPPGLRVVNVGGAATTTPGLAVVTEAVDGKHEIEFDIPWSVSDRDGELLRRGIITVGDGRVTLESAFEIPYGSRLASLAEHDFVHQDPAVLANLVVFILGDEILRPSGPGTRP